MDRWIIEVLVVLRNLHLYRIVIIVIMTNKMDYGAVRRILDAPKNYLSEELLMTKFVSRAVLAVSILFALVAIPASANPFLSYQVVVVIEALQNGGGGGAQCFKRTTYTYFSDGSTHILVETVCS